MVRRAVSPRAKTKLRMRLYVAGAGGWSQRLLLRVQALCKRLPEDSYELELIDLYRQTSQAKADGVLVAPTLVVSSPHPCRLLGYPSDDELERALNISAKPRARRGLAQKE